MKARILLGVCGSCALVRGLVIPIGQIPDLVDLYMGTQNAGLLLTGEEIYIETGSEENAEAYVIGLLKVLETVYGKPNVPWQNMTDVFTF